MKSASVSGVLRLDSDLAGELRPETQVRTEPRSALVLLPGQPALSGSSFRVRRMTLVPNSCPKNTSPAVKISPFVESKFSRLRLYSISACVPR